MPFHIELIFHDHPAAHGCCREPYALAERKKRLLFWTRQAFLNAFDHVLEKKFAIDHAYWKSKGVDWKIVTEKQISREKALNNCQWLHSGQTAEMLLATAETRKEGYVYAS